MLFWYYIIKRIRLSKKLRFKRKLKIFVGIQTIQNPIGENPVCKHPLKNYQACKEAGKYDL